MLKKTTIFSYESAMSELQTLVSQLQNEEIGIDELAEKVNRAAELIRLCREKLKQTTTEVEKAFG